MIYWLMAACYRRFDCVHCYSHRQWSFYGLLPPAT